MKDGDGKLQSICWFMRVLGVGGERREFFVSSVRRRSFDEFFCIELRVQYSKEDLDNS